MAPDETDVSTAATKADILSVISEVKLMKLSLEAKMENSIKELKEEILQKVDRDVNHLRSELEEKVDGG